MTSTPQVTHIWLRERLFDDLRRADLCDADKHADCKRQGFTCARQGWLVESASNPELESVR